MGGLGGAKRGRGPNEHPNHPTSRPSHVRQWVVRSEDLDPNGHDMFTTYLLNHHLAGGPFQ